MKYTFSYQQPHHHFITIDVEVDTTQKEEIVLQLPAWRPGRYELGNFAKNVRDFAVYSSEGKTLKSYKITIDSWKVECKDVDLVRVQYLYYAADLNAGSTFLDDNQLYVNPVNCCIYEPTDLSTKRLVEIKYPVDHQVATSLKKVGEDLYEAEDFHELADSPFIVSDSLQHGEYEVAGIPFHIWFQGEVRPDWERLITDFTKFTQYQIDAFGGFPVDEFHFLFQIMPYKYYHGVEHQKSTVIALGPSYAVFESFYTELLGVSSHELYHTWNVKAIRPNGLFPYDYKQENYTRSGYVTEGVTTYMGDLILLESGVFDEQQYQKEVEAYLTRHFHNGARNHYSVAESSFDTWLDGYEQGIPSRKTSIYVEGALTAMVCDMRIREASNGKYTLHDAMRKLYEQTNQEKGYSEQQYKGLLEEFAGVSFDDIFDDLIYGTNKFSPYINKALKYRGLQFDIVNSENEAENYGLKLQTKHGTMVVTDILENSAAYNAGLLRQDKIYAINNFPLEGNLSEWLLYFKGMPIELSLKREGALISIQLPPKNGMRYFKYHLNKIGG